MWIREPGKVSDRLDFLGARENCLYLLRGRDMMIIGGGMSWIVPSLQIQLSKIDFEPKKLKYLVVSHSHFDHCGAVPYLKKKFPHIQILASAHAEKIFAKQKAIDFIAVTNQYAMVRLGLQSEYERLDLKFDGFHVARIITEKDIIDLGDGIDVHFLEVPGHTQCSIAAYVPKLKILFPGDAAPPPTDDENTVFFPDRSITSACINNPWQDWRVSKLKYSPPSIMALSPEPRLGNYYKKGQDKRKGSGTALSRSTSRREISMRRFKKLTPKFCRGTNSTLWVWAGKCN